MWRFFWFLIILIASVWLGLKISTDPGYAVFAFRQWSIEMPLWFAVISFLIILVVFYAVLRFFDSIDMSIYRLKNWLRWRRKYKSYSKTNRGLIEAIEGHWRGAEYYLLEGVEQSDAPLINYLVAAKVAQEQGAFDRRDAYLRKAHQFAPSAEIAIGLMQAQLQLNQGTLEQALATLDRLRRIAPKHAVVLKLLEKVYVGLSDWQGLLKLLPSLLKAKLISYQELEHFQKKIYQELMRNAAHRQENVLTVHRIWQSIPKALQKDPELIYGYTKILLPHPEMAGDIDLLIVKALKKAWDKHLVTLYGLLETKEPAKQLAQAESWQKKYGKQAVLLLTLGRLYMRCQLWGKARSSFEESLRLEACPEAYAEYGKLLERLGEVTSAVRVYREGLLLESH